MMHSTFYWGKDLTLLVNSLRSESWTSYALILLLCFTISALYQKLETLTLKFADSRPNQPENAPLLVIRRKIGRNRTARICSAVVFGVNSAIGFVIMMAVMSYNGGVFVAVILGLIFGYYLFRSDDDDDDDDDLVDVSTM